MAAPRPGPWQPRQFCSALCRFALCCAGRCAPLCFALCRSALAYAGLLLSAPSSHFPCFSPAEETQFSVFSRQGTHTLRARGDLWTEVSDSGPWLVLMQMRPPNPSSLIGPNGTVLVGQNRAPPVGRSCTAPTGWGEPPSSWLK